MTTLIEELEGALHAVTYLAEHAHTAGDRQRAEFARDHLRIALELVRGYTRPAAPEDPTDGN